MTTAASVHKKYSARHFCIPDGHLVVTVFRDFRFPFYGIGPTAFIFINRRVYRFTVAIVGGYGRPLGRHPPGHKILILFVIFFLEKILQFMPVIRGDRPESRILIVDNDFIRIRLEDIRVYRINSRSSIADRIVDFRKIEIMRCR